MNAPPNSPAATDAMNDDEISRGAGRTRIEMRRQHCLARAMRPRGQVNLHAANHAQCTRYRGNSLMNEMNASYVARIWRMFGIRARR